MAKLAVLFLAALAFQASVAVPRYYEEGHLYHYLDEIKTEVRDLTVYFEKDFPEHPLAIRTVTWQCQRLVEVLEVIINKLRAETFIVHGDHQVFNDAIHTLEELVQVLRKVTVYHDISSIHELKKYFVLTIHTVLERFEQLVTLTYTYYPEFRYTLKYLLVDYMTALHGIRSHFMHIGSGFTVVDTPTYLIKEIHQYTTQFTNILKEFHHQTQFQVALRGYLYYVNEIVHKLQDKNILGHKELDVVIHQLTNKLREIVFPLQQVVYDSTVDVTVYRTQVITNCFEVVSIFEQLVQLCENKVLPQELTHFLVNVIYHYYYAVRHVSYEIKFGYKIGFYMPEYYNTEYYAKYGYGLYQKDFNRFYTPYHYETGVYTYPQPMNNYEYYMYTPYSYESLFPVYQHYGKTYNWYKYGSNYYNKYGSNYYGPSYYNKYESNYYSPSYYNKYGSNQYQYGYNYHNKNYYNTMQYNYQTPKEFVRTIQMLVNQVYQQYQYNTYEVKQGHPMVMYHIRHFIEFLDYVLEKFEGQMHYEQYYTDKYFEQYIYKLKEMRTELRDIVKTGIFTNIHEIRMRFVQYIQYVAGDLCKWFEQYGFEQVYFKEIGYRFITFLHQMNNQYYGYHYNHYTYTPVQGYGYSHQTYSYYPTYYNRLFKY